jgi:hypothetical protein
LFFTAFLAIKLELCAGGDYNEKFAFTSPLVGEVKMQYKNSKIFTA